MQQFSRETGRNLTQFQVQILDGVSAVIRVSYLQSM